MSRLTILFCSCSAGLACLAWASVSRGFLWATPAAVIFSVITICAFDRWLYYLGREIRK